MGGLLPLRKGRVALAVEDCIFYWMREPPAPNGIEERWGRSSGRETIER